MGKELKKLLLCLRWDIDNIEDLNAKRDYISGRISDIQELVKNCSIPDVVGQSEQLFCRDCKYDKSGTYHDKMWCRDCRQKDRFTAK